ncbi:MAG: outer membrane beta-barrel protein [Gemmatimonadaceae bacterium]
MLHIRGVTLATTLAASLIVAVAGPARAQRAGVGFGASIGANVPSGRFDEGAQTGLVASGFLALRFSGSVALRGELFWSRSDLDSPLIREIEGEVLPSSGFDDLSGDVNLVGGLASLVLAMGTPGFQPYLIGGVGAYRRRVAQDIEGTIDEFRSLRTTDTDFGWNGGAGVRLGFLGTAIFLEARYHSVATQPERTTFVPVTIGLEF